jgi:hypothetical protein
MKITEVEAFFEEEEDRPDSYDTVNQLRYHYTDFKALKNILESKAIRLTSYESLNDSTEGKYLIEQLDGKIDNYDKFTNLMLKNLYIGCFSFYGNLLSQWCRYGEFSIGFDWDLLKEEKRIEDQEGENRYTSGVTFHKCEYVSSEENDYKCLISSLQERTKDIDYNNIQQVQYTCLTCSGIAFSIKPLSFFEENEWRIVSHLYTKDPFIKEGGNTRFIKYNFDPKAIRRIVVGPSDSQEENIRRVEDFLTANKKDYGEVEIVKSLIPYKPKRSNCNI